VTPRRRVVEVSVNAGVVSHLGLALDKPYRVDTIKLSGDVGSFAVTDIQVDGESQLVRDEVAPERTSPQGKAIWRTLNLILGPPRQFRIGAAVFMGRWALNLDTAKKSVVIVIKNEGDRNANLVAEFGGYESES
jgi:hypothetical protein